ncbi:MULTISPECIES: GGDEF domain-containing protein [Exiguobacterium]|uniref:GGDEF domain-containing protein n=1 Tax=Exiguobacterium TaxID=33986 RepID=UPI00203544B6|nr:MULTISPECIES: diguanylate cyclase [Exiguobacterium]MCT4777725.1 diguanylate cyclase [Exiguobacterium aquaticum]MCT4789785.1 diguanylate cyclase [Exiguobacterium mexicanum]
MKTKFSLLQRYLLISLMALFLTSVWSYSAFQDIEQENRRIVEEAIPISNAASELFRLLLDQELSVRGYTYNQDAQSLEQYEATKRSLVETIQVIRELDDRHPIMQQLIQDEALPLIQQMEAFHASQIELIEAGDVVEANARRFSGIDYINQFRDVDAALREDIDKIIQQATLRSETASNSAKWVIFIVVGIALLLLLTFMHTFRLERSKQALIHRSLHDALTGIWNRRAFDEKLERMWDEATDTGDVLALLLLDIDAFKTFNDTYGHLAGDACLERVAKAIHRAVGEDGMTARYGGEEFAVLLRPRHARQPKEIAERIRQAVLKLNIAHETYTPLRKVSVSIGVAEHAPSLSGDKTDLIAAADQALYQAKQSGRNRVSVGQATNVG